MGLPVIWQCRMCLFLAIRCRSQCEQCLAIETMHLLQTPVCCSKCRYCCTLLCKLHLCFTCLLSQQCQPRPAEAVPQKILEYFNQNNVAVCIKMSHCRQC